MNEYFYCIIKTMLKEKDGIGSRIQELDLPDDIQIYSQMIIQDDRDITYDLHLNQHDKNKDVIACIAVNEKDKELIKLFEGYIGTDYEEIKKNPDYMKHVADQRKFCQWEVEDERRS